MSPLAPFGVEALPVFITLSLQGPSRVGPLVIPGAS